MPGTYVPNPYSQITPGIISLFYSWPLCLLPHYKRAVCDHRGLATLSEAASKYGLPQSPALLWSPILRAVITCLYWVVIAPIHTHLSQGWVNSIRPGNGPYKSPLFFSYTWPRPKEQLWEGLLTYCGSQQHGWWKEGRQAGS